MAVSRRSVLRAVIRWIGLPISVAAIAILIASVPIADAAVVISRAAVLPLLAAAAVIGVQVAIVTKRWQLLLPLRPDGRRPRYGSTASAVLLGYLGNFVLPARLGEAVRAYAVATSEQLPLARTLGSVALERVIDTVTIALVAAAIAIALDVPTWVMQVTLVVAGIGVAALILFLSDGHRPVVRWILQRLPQRMAGPDTTVGRQADLLVAGLTGRGRLPVVGLAFVLSMTSWVLESLVYFLVARALRVDLSLAESLLIASVTVLATAVPSAPAYVGTFELAATALAVALGVPATDALAFAVLAHVTTVAPLALGGLVSLSTVGMGLGRLARMTKDELPGANQATSAAES